MKEYFLLKVPKGPNKNEVPEPIWQEFRIQCVREKTTMGEQVAAFVMRWVMRREREKQKE